MSGEPHLRLGAHDPWVQYAQTMMEDLGVPAGKPVDEVFDEHTHHQVLTFQQEHQLHASGELDEHTWAALGGVEVVHEQGEQYDGERRGQDMALLRDSVVQIGKDFLKGHFDHVTRAAQDFHQHASDQAQLVGEVDGPDIGGLFDVLTIGIAVVFPEAELAHLVAELVVADYKAAIDAGKVVAANADRRTRADIIGLAQHLHDTTVNAGEQAYKTAEKALTSDVATAALQLLDQLPMAHEREWLEYCVERHLGILNPAQHSAYLSVREPLEEQLARIVAKHEFEKKNGTPDTPFWTQREQDQERDAVVDVQIDYEHRGWREDPGTVRPAPPAS